MMLMMGRCLEDVGMDLLELEEMGALGKKRRESAMRSREMGRAPAASNRTTGARAIAIWQVLRRRVVAVGQGGAAHVLTSPV